MNHSTQFTLGLLWHSVNSDNLGVGALSAAQIVILEEIAKELEVYVQFKIFGWSDPEPAYVVGPNIEFVAMRGRDFLNPAGLYAQVRACDFVLDISAGDSFADIYGARRFLYNFLSKINVLTARRPLVLSPQTIGPFNRWWTKRLAFLAMSGAKKVVTRDSLSSDYLTKLGLGSKLIEATDVAFRLPYTPPAPKIDDTVRVGLNVSGLLFNGGYSRNNMFSLSADYQELIRALCKSFMSITGTELHLIGHVNSARHEVEDDYRVGERIAAEFPGAIVAPRFKDPSEAKSYIAGMDFFAGSRMHACIAAFSSGVPVVPIAYSRKFAGLFGTLGYDRLADCKTQDATTIHKIVLDGFKQRDLLKSEVDEALIEAGRKQQAYKDLLRKLFAEVSESR